LKEEIFVDSQIFENHKYNTKLNATEIRAWEAFGNVCRNFLNNELEENCS